MLKEETKTEYFPALTGLRAVAALLVLVHHFNPLAPYRFGWWVHSLAAELHIGVTVFFVLSGFLIGYRYLAKPVALRAYFANRIARIYPIYFLLTTLTFAVLYRSSPDGKATQLVQYLLNISFLRGLFEEYVYTGVAQGWSLTVEEMFYASAPLAFVLIRRNWHWLWALPLGLMATGVGLVLLSHGQLWHGFFGSFGFLFQFTYPGRAVEFFVGIALAWWLQKTSPQRCAFPWLTYIGLANMLVCVVGLSLLHGREVGAFGVQTPTGMLINNVGLPVLGVGPLLWGLVREPTWLRRLLSSTPLLLLGKSSYVFYLIHMGVLQQWLRERISNPLVVILVLYATAIALYWLVEEPLNHWLRRALRGPAVAQPN